MILLINGLVGILTFSSIFFSRVSIFTYFPWILVLMELTSSLFSGNVKIKISKTTQCQSSLGL